MHAVTPLRALFLMALFLSCGVMRVMAAEKIYTVAGDSMSPALRAGQQIVIALDDFLPLQQGDLVAIQLKSRSNPMVKRVVALPGDRLSIISGRLYVNSEKLLPELVMDSRRWHSTIRQLQNYNWIIPPGTIFILGDNRQNSLDSRRLGLISIDQVSGKVVRQACSPFASLP
jgi:signal peptidase I